MRTAARKDANHVQIVELFKILGWSVLDIAQLKNCCDIFVSKHNITIAIEIKDGEKPPSQRKLTDGELKFKNEWKGLYEIVICDDDVLNINNKMFKPNA